MPERGSSLRSSTYQAGSINNRTKLIKQIKNIVVALSLIDLVLAFSFLLKKYQSLLMEIRFIFNILNIYNVIYSMYYFS